MSKIDLVISSAPDLARSLAVLRRVDPAASVGELRRRISAGEPVIEVTLFENDHLEVSKRLRELVRELPAAGANLRIFELQPDEKFDASSDLARWEIDSQTLVNILDNADPSYR